MNPQKSIRLVRQFSRLINSKLFKSVAEVDKALREIGSVDGQIAAAQIRTTKANNEAKNAERKLQVFQNALTAAEAEVHAERKKISKAKTQAETIAPSILSAARKQASQILDRARDKTADAVREELDRRRTCEILDGEIAKKARDLKNLEGKISALKQQMRSLST
ncbi:MAG: hypothetical protein O6952_05740 [Planctomycetota bacterium]|nr:hypothetical protein [Planctomycetota bacterium]